MRTQIGQIVHCCETAAKIQTTQFATFDCRAHARLLTPLSSFLSPKLFGSELTVGASFRLIPGVPVWARN